MPTLGEACQQLRIGRVTLAKWIKRLGIETTRHEWDYRFEVIAPEDVERIAEARKKLPALARAGVSIPSYNSLAFDRRDSDGLGYTAASPTVTPTPRQRPLQRGPVSASQQMLANNPLPPGWMAVSTFCRRHNLNDRSVGRSSHMPPPTVAPDGAPWGNFSPKANIWQALHTVYTAEQVRQAVAQAARYWPQRFTACPDCPHQKIAEGAG